MDATTDDVIRDVYQPPIPVETEIGRLPRLRRRAKKSRAKARNIAQILTAAGESDEVLALLSDVKAVSTDYTEKTSQNAMAKAAGRPPPWSEEVLQELRPRVSVYKRILRLADALVAGDPERIQKAREIVQQDYRPRAYTDDELQMALTDEEAERYKKLRPSVNEWKRFRDESIKAGRSLRRHVLTPEQRQLEDASFEYTRLNYIVQQGLGKQTPGRTRPAKGTRWHKDAKLKALLDLVSLADFARGRRLSTEYATRRKKAISMGVNIRDLPPEMTSKESFNEVQIGRQLYKDMLEVVKLEEEAASRGQTTAAEGRRYRLDDGDKLFTPEEAQRAKQWLDLPEIEEYVDGKWAERDLPRAQASLEAARREDRHPLVSQKDLNDLQNKINRYKELQKTVAEREAHSLQAGQNLGSDKPALPVKPEKTKKGTKKNTLNNDDPPPPPPPLKQPQNHQGQQIQQPSPEEQGRRQSELLPKPIRPNDPLQLVTNPTSLTDQVRAGWKQLGNGLQNVPGTITSQVSERARQVGPWIGSIARTGPRVQMPMPAGFRAPLPI